MGNGDKTIGYTECYVVFLDILGFRDLVRRSVENGEVRSVLVRVLTEVASLRGDKQGRSRCELDENGNKNVITECWSTQIRSFSDSVVIFVPYQSTRISGILHKIRYLHDRLLELGCCVRGGMTIGDMYWDKNWFLSAFEKEECKSSNPSGFRDTIYDRHAPASEFITLGPGLIEAYLLESEVAIYPRVVLSPRLVTYIHETFTDRSEWGQNRGVSLWTGLFGHSAGCIADLVRTDSDGVPFLDLFHKDIYRSDTERIERVRLPSGLTCLRRSKSERVAV